MAGPGPLAQRRVSNFLSPFLSRYPCQSCLAICATCLISGFVTYAVNRIICYAACNNNFHFRYAANQ